MANRTCRVGVHGRNDTTFSEDDYRVIAESCVEAIKMMSLTDPAVFAHIKAINPDIEIITRLYDDRIHHGHPTPAEFADKMIPIMQALRPHCTKFQIANEPNHVQRYEGWGAEDADAADFNAWFLAVYQLLKQACPWASLGFPGLAVPDFAHRDRTWLAICQPAIEQADWLGVHCYWQTPTDRPSVMFDEQFGLTFKYYHAQYPNKTLEILECGNSNVHNPAWPISQDDIAREYVTWLQEVFRYPYINSTAFFLLSSPDTTNWDFFAWRTENNFVKPVAHAIATMHRPPRISMPDIGPGSGPTVPTQPPPPAEPPSSTEPAQPRPQPTTPPETPGPSLPLPTLRGRYTNNQIIDAFYDASVKLGLGDWTLMGKAGVSLDVLVRDRAASYDGPEFDQMTELSPIEQQALRTELADFDAVSFEPGVFEPVGLLWSRADLATVRPSLPRALQIPAARATNSLQRRVIAAWNGYGWLILRVSELLWLPPAAAVAVLAVYAPGPPFGRDGRLTVRFEPHIFYDLWGEEYRAPFARHFRFDLQRPWQGHAWRADPDSPWRKVHASHADEWGALTQAHRLDEDAALAATSLGAPRIMGFNHALAGFESAGQMFDAFRASRRNQILAFFDFIGDPTSITPAVQALQQYDLVAFAARYSGSHQAAVYAPQLQAAADWFRSLQTTM